MPFRAKLKKAFGGGRSSSKSSTPSGDGSHTPNGHHTHRTDVEYYKPGEIPRSKYRGPWNKEHQEKLHSFSFNFGGRQSSLGGSSDWSPTASRAQSRRSSWISGRRPSTSGKSGKGRKSSERARHRLGEQKLDENAGDDDVANVGKSRPQTSNGETPVAKDVENENPLDQTKTVTQTDLQKPENGAPFTEEELTKALTAATLKPGRADQ